MAQTGFTPIQLYSSSTATNVPLAANLATCELAIKITDGKLFYKDNAAAVQVIGWKTVPATAGGTGQTSFAVGDLLYANTTTTIAKLADVATGNALISGGVGVAPSYGKIGLTTHVSGTLPTANGGTNLTSFTANGVVYASSTSALATGSALVFDGTKFGIGVASPSQHLSVSGTDGSNNVASFTRASGSTMYAYVDTGANVGFFTGSNASGSGFYANSSDNSVKFMTNSAEKARFNSTGALVFAGGTTTANGIGITFPATQSASSNANTLDDYEEGTWTSAVSNLANVTGTGSLDRADYIKIGSLVTIVGRISGLTITTVLTGTSIGLTLPFATKANDTVVMGSCRGSGSTEMIGIVLDATGTDATSIALNFPAAQVTGNGSTTFSFSLTYIAA